MKDSLKGVTKWLLPLGDIKQVSWGGVFGVILGPTLRLTFDPSDLAVSTAIIVLVMMSSIIPVWFKVTIGASVKSMTRPR